MDRAELSGRQRRREATSQTVKEKFETGALDSLDYSSFIFVGIQAGISQWTDSYPEFRQGAVGYSRYYWHTFADQTDENLWVEAVLPSVLRQDSRLRAGSWRLYQARHLCGVANGNHAHRHGTRNLQCVGGPGIRHISRISSLYYPQQERTWTKTGQRWLLNALLDLGTFGAKEFWPDINHAIFHESDD